MALGDNVVIPLFEEGDRPTAAVTAATLAGRFVKPTGIQGGGPLLDLSTPTSPLTKGNVITVAQCVAGDKACGVTEWDTVAADDIVGLLSGPGMIIPMPAGAAIAAGAEVQSDANGQPITLAAGKSLGQAINAAAGASSVVFIRLSF